MPRRQSTGVSGSAFHHESPRICVYGAGAIGGFLAARLAHAGLTVSCVARGPHLEAMQSRGLRLVENDGELLVNVPCTESPAELGAQDIVLLTLKAHTLVDAVAGIRELLGPATTVVTIQNGLPWWYFYQDASPFNGRHLDCVDPGGQIWKAIGPERAIGASVYPAAELAAPGVVRHIHGKHFRLGEPTGTVSRRLTEICNLLDQSELQATPTTDIRRDIWQKLAISAGLNPLSLLRAVTIGEILKDDNDRELLRSLVREAQQVARSLGVTPAESADDLVTALEAVGPHKTSMLTDFEAGRTLELDAVTGAVVEVAELTQVPTPRLRQLYAQVQQRIQK